MQRNLWMVLSVFVMAAAVACGGGGDAAAPAAPAAPAFDPATAGNVSGMVMLDGEMPAPEELMMNSDPVCAMEASNRMSQSFVGANGHLGNVFVYVTSGLEGQSFPAATGTVTLNQQGCRYTPHVFGIRVGQTLEIVNTVSYGGVETAQYPLSIYRPWFRHFFTFVVPWATVSYFPALAILDKPDPLGSPLWFQYAAPVIGLVFLIVCLRVWEFGVRHYLSTGS